MRTAACVVTFAVLAAGVPIETQGTATFEVASIRPNLTRNQQGAGLAAAQPGGRYIARGVTLRRLVQDAYGPDEVIGGPEWTDADRFDVDARADRDRPIQEIARMLRSLLTERFNLLTHVETREVPVYFLALAREDSRLGPDLRESDSRCAEEAARYVPALAAGDMPPCGDFRLGGRSLIARGMTMAGLAGRLAGRVDRHVIDRTGLPAAYDLELEWSSDVGLRQPPPGAAGADELQADGLSLFTALQEQLGLRLEPGRGPVNVIVIDRAERPTPN